MKRLKVLMSAYACEPGKGSEPGIGWNTAKAVAAHHDVWVITRANNRARIEAELTREPVPGLRFAYYDLPAWAAWWKAGGRGVRLYYYLWQLGVYPLAARLHKEVGFDLTHHVTFGLYWAPSLVSLLPTPFVWGPVGGGESAPKAFWPDFSAAGRRYERLREINQRLATLDPLVRLTAARSAKALATTKETLERLEALRLAAAEVQGNCALSGSEIALLRDLPKHDLSKQTAKTLTFVSIGRLLHWKGFHLAIRAFAAAKPAGGQYWLIGDGPERSRLEQLAAQLGVADSVVFTGALTREETLQKLAQSDVFLHPSLHDSGGWATLEAMAAGKPVICLDLGGPGMQITEETGVKVAALSPQQVERDLARAVACLRSDEARRRAMGRAGQRRVAEVYSWARKGRQLDQVYQQLSKEVE